MLSMPTCLPLLSSALEVSSHLACLSLVLSCPHSKQWPEWSAHKTELHTLPQDPHSLVFPISSWLIPMSLCRTSSKHHLIDKMKPLLMSCVRVSSRAFQSLVCVDSSLLNDQFPKGWESLITLRLSGGTPQRNVWLLTHIQSRCTESNNHLPPSTAWLAIRPTTQNTAIPGRDPRQLTWSLSLF